MKKVKAAVAVVGRALASKELRGAEVKIIRAVYVALAAKYGWDHR